jgi:hypothetical protein
VTAAFEHDDAAALDAFGHGVDTQCGRDAILVTGDEQGRHANAVLEAFERIWTRTTSPVFK